MEPLHKSIYLTKDNISEHQDRIIQHLEFWGNNSVLAFYKEHGVLPKEVKIKDPSIAKELGFCKHPISFWVIERQRLPYFKENLCLIINGRTIHHSHAVTANSIVNISVYNIVF